MNPSIFEAAAGVIRDSVRVDIPVGPLHGAELVAVFERRTQRKAQHRRWAWGAGALSLVIGFSVPLLHKGNDLSYRVGATSQLGVVGSYVSASATQSLDLHFSEGSEVVLQPKTRARIASTTSQGATIVLENGRARADIVHRAQTNWRILAGPYVVGVTGTSFDVSYDVSTQTFELDMNSGTVKVWGPGLVNPVEIRDRQRFVLSGGAVEPPREVIPIKEEGLPVPSNDPSASAKALTSVVAPEASPVPSKPGHEISAQANPGSAEVRAASVATESWSKLSARGQHRRIVELAEQQGVDTAAATASAPDLLALGNSARFSGKPALAAKAYRALRDRFSRSPEASNAAFFLGRLSELSSPSQAITWYEQYVAEAPGGAWVADALGRRMVILNNTSEGALVQAAAKEYLRKFPHGPYAGFASVIVGQ